MSGVLLPGRLTLLLGPPSCGKTTLLKALAGKMGTSALKVMPSSCLAGPCRALPERLGPAITLTLRPAVLLEALQSSDDAHDHGMHPNDCKQCGSWWE